MHRLFFYAEADARSVVEWGTGFFIGLRPQPRKTARKRSEGDERVSRDRSIFNGGFSVETEGETTTHVKSAPEKNKTQNQDFPIEGETWKRRERAKHKMRENTQQQQCRPP